MYRSNCCNEPVYMDVVDTGDRIGESICVKMIYKCSKCNMMCGAVTMATMIGGGDGKRAKETVES